MNTQLFNIIKPTELLARIIKEADIKAKIIAEVNKFVHLIESPTLLAVSQYISILVENSVKKSDKIDKMALVVSIFHEVWPNITDAEIAQIKAQIEHLLVSGQILKIPILKYGLHLSKELLKKTIGHFFLIN
jgi:hypothetical protein